MLGKYLFLCVPAFMINFNAEMIFESNSDHCTKKQLLLDCLPCAGVKIRQFWLTRNLYAEKVCACVFEHMQVIVRI